MSSRDAPGRDQLVEAALALIGERGLKGATVRAVASRARVTPGLVVHHFGTKEMLAAEVERAVLARFDRAMAIDADTSDPTSAATSISERLSHTLGSDPDLRRYLRRALLEPSPAGIAILQRLVELTMIPLRRFKREIGLPSAIDMKWLAVQIVVINLAATILEPALEPALGRRPFTASEVAKRTKSNLRFLSSALGHLCQE